MKLLFEVKDEFEEAEKKAREVADRGNANYETGRPSTIVTEPVAGSKYDDSDPFADV